MDSSSDKPNTARGAGSEDLPNQSLSGEASHSNDISDFSSAGQTGRPTQPDSTRAVSTPRVFTSAELFAGERQILIEHAGATYRLQITKQGKLILTK